MKSLKIIITLFILFALAACATQSRQPTSSVVQQTPKFSALNQGVDYLGTALTEGLKDVEPTGQISESRTSYSQTQVNETKPLTPEEQTRLNAGNAMDDLEREIAKKEGRVYKERKPAATSVKSKEEYITHSSTNMGASSSGSGKPMVVAVADFINEDGKVSKLGHYISSKLTPYLARSQKFSVLERGLIDKVIEEQHFQVSPFVDEASTQKFGKLLGAETIISGTITEMDNIFYINAKAIGVTRGNLITSVDVEIDKTGRLVTLYRTDLPKPVKKKNFRPRIFRAKGLGVPSPKYKNNPALAGAMAGRAAQVIAMRNLIQEVQGARINSQTTIKDFMTESDSVTLQVNSRIRGARVINKKIMPDGTVEVEMEVEMSAEFFENLDKMQNN